MATQLETSFFVTVFILIHPAFPLKLRIFWEENREILAM